MKTIEEVRAEVKRAMDLLDTALGDTDPDVPEKLTQEEIETEYPVLSAMQIIVGLYTGLENQPRACAQSPAAEVQEQSESVWQTSVPPTKAGDHNEYILAVKRKQAKDPNKVFVFAANYANAYTDDDSLKDCDGQPLIANGWYSTGSDMSGEFSYVFEQALSEGDVVMGWQPLPKWSEAQPSNSAAPVVAQAEAKVSDELVGVAEVIAEGGGFWRTCSGCHETVDGHPVGHYPYSKVMKCDLGAGCGDCGGIGAVWDNTDYEAMGRDIESRDTGMIAASSDAADGCQAVAFDMLALLQRQRVFSERTFGPGRRTKMVIDHIRKELIEIEAHPSDLTEWIDVILLALDGAWRCGATPARIAAGIEAKQMKNEGRAWPDWRTADPDKAIEHRRVPEETHAPVLHTMTRAVRDVLAERARQVSAEGWTPEHDDEHTSAALAVAGACYALFAAAAISDSADAWLQEWRETARHLWPYDAEWLKTTTPRRDLEKASSMIIAEMERLDRAESRRAQL